MKTKHLVLVALFAALISIGAQIKVPLGPIPFTLQLPIVLLSGLLLGSKLGALSATVYLLIGLIGVPVYAGGGGISSLLSPSFGFIIGFIPAAYISGIGHKAVRPIYLSLIYVYLGTLVSFLFGLVYFIFVMHYLIDSPTTVIGAVMITIAPFIIKDLITGALTVLFAQVLKKRGIMEISH